MKERGILFSAPMVRALLAGTKTQTRRAIKLPADVGEVIVDPGGTAVFGPGPYIKAYKANPEPGDAIVHPRIRCPYGYPGDRLWVRETWRTAIDLDKYSPTQIAERALAASYPKPWAPLKYEADDVEVNRFALCDFGDAWGKTRTAIHLPRWASRITLEIAEVRAERLHDITEADSWAEGIASVDGMIDAAAICAAAKLADCSHEDARATFAALWCEINGVDSWKANPWVWAITFKRIDQTLTRRSA